MWKEGRREVEKARGRTRRKAAVPYITHTFSSLLIPRLSRDEKLMCDPEENRQKVCRDRAVCKRETSAHSGTPAPPCRLPGRGVEGACVSGCRAMGREAAAP